MSTVYLPYDVTSTHKPLYRFKSGSVEQMAHHEQDKLMYLVGRNIFHVVNCSEPDELTWITSTQIESQDLTDIEVERWQ
ncbi:hypothetical protein Btru_075619 [Bulinus truncatus]|nr:hypothetical protein Btru_075619 [Bulinus truncatus]